LVLETPQVSFRYNFLNTVRALLVSLFLGIFTLSVGGMLTYVLNLGLVGGVLGISNALGLSPLMVFSAGVLPHGVFEITVLVISSAAILHMGVMLVTPDPGRTLSQVLIESLASWFRIMTGFGIPLLVVAALVETYVTPQLIQNILK
jgi:stage II sporulation protein M